MYTLTDMLQSNKSHIVQFVKGNFSFHQNQYNNTAACV